MGNGVCTTLSLSADDVAAMVTDSSSENVVERAFRKAYGAANIPIQAPIGRSPVGMDGL